MCWFQESVEENIKLGNFQCINPKKGSDGGDTWEKRLEDLNNMHVDEDGTRN